MNREEIYDHLAQVYLGKRKKVEVKRKHKHNAWLFINIITALIIFSSAFYGLSAFLEQRRSTLKKNVILSLHNGPVNLAYDFRNYILPAKVFSLNIQGVDAWKYKNIEFSVRALEDGTPGTIRVEFINALNEASSYYVQGIDEKWTKVKVPLDKFKQITDWGNIKEIGFIVETWNARDPAGTVLIDDILFSENNI
ncbi:MAG: hypothetical protein HQL27_04365 [Candidatus Omnitrophica bacterium]|nr:hypothetical protein [Candidatus Omnitrophota bacterium]